MSDKSVAEKLLFKENYRALLLNEPENYRKTLGELPSGVAVSTSVRGAFDLVQAFVSSQKELEAALKKIKGSLKPNGLLWMTYPKGTSKIKTDINPIPSGLMWKPADIRPSRLRWMTLGLLSG